MKRINALIFIFTFAISPLLGTNEVGFVMSKDALVKEALPELMKLAKPEMAKAVTKELAKQNNAFSFSSLVPSFVSSTMINVCTGAILAGGLVAGAYYYHGWTTKFQFRSMDRKTDNLSKAVRTMQEFGIQDHKQKLEKLASIQENLENTGKLTEAVEQSLNSQHQEIKEMLEGAQKKLGENSAAVTDQLKINDEVVGNALKKYQDSLTSAASQINVDLNGLMSVGSKDIFEQQNKEISEKVADISQRTTIRTQGLADRIKAFIPRMNNLKSFFTSFTDLYSKSVEDQEKQKRRLEKISGRLDDLTSEVSGVANLLNPNAEEQARKQLHDFRSGSGSLPKIKKP